MRDLGRLLRLSLMASAAADVACGMVLGLGAWPQGGGPWLMILAGLAVYHGGMALNDWADRDVDAQLRPDRPIPKGTIPAGAALFLALSLLAAGPTLAFGVDPRLGGLVAGTAALAALYDLLGRGPWLGPLLLALCRAGNLASGLLFAQIVQLARMAERPGEASAALDLVQLAPVPLLYGAYVFLVSRLGRMEDAEDGAPLGRRPARMLAGLAALLLVLPVLPLPPLGPVAPGAEESAAWVRWLAAYRIPLATLLAAGGAFGLLRQAFSTQPWTRGRVLACMGMALRRLLIFTSAATLLRGTPAALLVALILLAGFPLSFWLRKLFPPS